MSLPMSPSGSVDPRAAVDADEIQRQRELAEARGIIRDVHTFCARSCPHRERCPGMECRLYRKEMAAKDVIARHAEAEERIYGPAGVVMGIEQDEPDDD